MKQLEIIDGMQNINEDEATILTDNAGNYFFQINGEPNNRIFASWDEVTTFLYKRGFIW